MRRWLFCALLGLLLAPDAGAASASAPAEEADEAASRPQTLRAGAVAQIVIRGQHKVERDAIRANIRSLVGEAPDAALLREDLRRIFEMGLFDDVRLYQRERSDGTIDLVVEVVEKPAIHDVLYEGNDRVSKDDISEVVDVKAFQVLDVPKLRRNVEKIQNLYVEKGYYLAEVRYEVRPAGDEAPQKPALFDFVTSPKQEVVSKDKPNGPTSRPAEAVAKGELVDVVFIVNEKAKVLIERVSFVGNKALKDEDIKPFLATSEGTLISFVTDWGTYKEEAFSTDLMRIEALYHDNGYVNVKVGKPRIRLTADKRRMHIAIPISEGDQYRLGAKAITGDLLESESELLKLITIEPAAIFKRSQIAEDLEKLTDYYKDRGYAYVNVMPLTLPHEDKKTLDLTLEINQGPLVTVERIELHGNDKTRDKVIRRELRVYEGELFTGNGLRESERRVNQLGYFEKVDVSTHRGSAPDRIVVAVHVKEKSTGTFQISFGFSSYEAFVGQAQVVQDNFIGYGTRLSLTGQISSRRRIFDFEYTDPYFLDTRLSFSLNLFNTENDYYDFRRASTGGELTWGYPLDFGIRYLDNVYVYFGYFAERVEIPEEAFNVTLVGLETNTPRWTSALRGTVTYDSRNNRLFPSDGYFALLRGEWATPYLLSQNDFARVTAVGRGYWPIAWGIVLKSQLRFGLIYSPDRIPIFESYREGGYGSIRGYYTRSIGPVERVGGLDPANPLVYFNVGGNKSVLGNVELEFPIVDKVGIRGVLFADCSNAYGANENWLYLGQRPDARLANEPWDPVRDLPLGLYYSAGFGIRWFSPIGPLRFEWGFPLTRRPPGTRGLASGDEMFLFEFNIGNPF